MRWSQPPNRELVRTIHAAFRSDDRATLAARLRRFRAKDWQRSTLWMDASGLALYFLDRVETLGIADAVEPSALARLRKNLANNTLRQQRLLDEFIALNYAFTSAGVRFVNLKGFTLGALACPRPELRRQSDLDFLVAPHQMPLVATCLAKRGYYLTAATPNTWEFKAGKQTPAQSSASAYIAGAYPSIEVHYNVSRTGISPDPRLDRISVWEHEGHGYPALAPADVLLLQAEHILSHLRSERTRPSWLLEFRSHVIGRAGDAEFWSDLRQLCDVDARAGLALGLCLQLTTKLFGDFAPQSVEAWALAFVPRSVRLWVEHYGVRSVMAPPPGTKLCLFLEQALAECAEETSAAAARARLFPKLRLPGAYRACGEETFRESLQRNMLRTRFIFYRLRFHATQGLECILETPRWKRLLSRSEPHAHIAQSASVSVRGKSDNPQTTW